VTSSAIKNVKKDLLVDKLDYALYLTDAGNLGESIVSLYEVLYAPTSDLRRLDGNGLAVPISDGKTIAMRASAKKLTGPLGRQTYIFENHFCVVDLPVRGGSVEVLFVGAKFKDGTLATATTSVQTDNAPSSFDLLPWLLAQGVPLEVARPKAKPDEYGRF